MGMQNEKRKIKIVKESNGKNLVIVEDIRFKGRRGINWKEVERYNIFSVRLLIRHAQDGAMYLYDVLRTKKESNKKETSKPTRQ